MKIATYFHKTSRRYSPGLMKITFETISKAYQVSKVDNNGSLDNYGYHLFFTTEFNNLAEELKYALRNDKIDFNSLISIINCLIKLEYVDH